MFEYMLPLGSVVLLKKAAKKAMIIGYLQVKDMDDQKVFDYVGVVYPMGSMGPASQFLFNKEDIADVIFKGYANPEWDEMVAMLEKEFEEHPELAEKLKRTPSEDEKN